MRISKKIIGKYKLQILKSKEIKLKLMDKSKIYPPKWSMLLLILVPRLRLNSKIREVEGMVEDLEVEEEGVGAIILIEEEELDIHHHMRDNRIREGRNSISKINIEEEVEVEDVVVEAIIHSSGTKRTTQIVRMISMSFRRRVKNNTSIREEDVDTSGDEELEVKEVSSEVNSEAKEVNSEVVEEVVVDSNHRRLMSNQK